MKRGVVVLLILLCAAGVFAVPDAVPGEFIVRYRDTLSADSVDALHVKHGVEAREVARSRGARTELVKVPPGQLKRIMAQYERLAGVEFVEPNFLLPVDASASDPSFKDQYALNVVN